MYLLLHLTHLAILQTLLLILHREHGRIYVSIPYHNGVPVKFVCHAVVEKR